VITTTSLDYQLPLQIGASMPGCKVVLGDKVKIQQQQAAANNLKVHPEPSNPLQPRRVMTHSGLHAI
jgi:hypothetical protein